MVYNADLKSSKQECIAMKLTVSELLDLSHTLAGDYLAKFAYTW